MRICAHCEKLIESPGRGGRRKYHPECLGPARIADRRRCTKCRKTKQSNKFSNDASRPDGKFPWCMACQLKGHYAASFQDPNAPLNGNICPVDDVPCRGPKNRRYCSNTCKGKARHWRRQFNLTVEQARALIEWAGGKCPICKKNSLNLNMDHNHKTKLVYGPACAVCNTTLLAYSYHDPEIARRLLNFLENPPALALGIKVFAPEMSNKSRLHEMWEFTEQDRKIAAGGKPF